MKYPIIMKIMVNENCSEIFVKRSLIPCDLNTLFEYHTRNGALERLVPPWSGLKIVDQRGGIKDNALSIFQIRLGPISLKWIAKHFGYSDNRQFQDRMIRGPFKKWIHTHSFEPQGPNHCIIEDKIDYTPKFGKVGSKLIQKRLQNYLHQLFIYRSRILDGDTYLEKMTGETGKNILITGSHGLIGSALIPLLTAVGKYKITRLVRNVVNNNITQQSTALNRTSDYERSIFWEPEQKRLELNEFEGFDVVIHLAGENIFGRWNDTKKQRIFDSRVGDTTLLCESLAKLSKPPSLLISASAIGYYGNRPNEMVTEDSNPGRGFLSEVCQKWEDATKVATEAGIRVVNTRFGVVLSPKGGILKKLLAPFKVGLEITIGNKDSYISWVSIEDVIRTIFHSIINTSTRGAVNVVSPNSVTNLEFAKTLKKLYNPYLSLSINQNLTKLVFGEMSDEVLSTDSCVTPKKLLSNGYQFINPGLEDTLRFLLGKLDFR